MHDFQKWAIEGIFTGNHVLITAPTGTGKTLPAQYAIIHFNSLRKKVIYTCPIKALCNEKYYSFTKEYPDISVGLITGDISCNPSADILIMTLEILMNKLYDPDNKLNKSTSFEIDIMNDLGCVVFDEIHFINDEKRGTNWEQTIMMMPSHIQIIGLSATLDNPSYFAEWLENTLNSSVESSVRKKEVYLCRKLIRSVPLIHYSFIATTTTINKKIKDKEIQKEIQQNTDKLITLQDEKGVFNDTNYQKIQKTLKLFEKNDIRIKRRHVLNKLCEHLVETEMLPALCYVFSRKYLEVCANELNTNLLEFDSKVPYVVDYECEQILRKLPNYHEYLQLPEYLNAISLFRKGIGMHHAGLIPILREMTELLFSKGYIKILFCTETMSVGINLPVKTTIFTDIYKFNGDTLRILHGHEYTQAAGRAGRLGHDKVGHVIHLTSLFKPIESISLKNMMKGTPQKLTSKFNISYNLILNLVKNDKPLDDFIEQSMIKNNITGCINEFNLKNCELQQKINNNCLRNSEQLICEYIDLKDKRSSVVNKKRKHVEMQIQNILETTKFIEEDSLMYLQKENLKNELEYNNLKLQEYHNYFLNKINHITSRLKDFDFIDVENKLTLKGQVASNLREVHCIIFTNILFGNGLFHEFNSIELTTILSCFTNISIPNDKKELFPHHANNSLNIFLASIKEEYDNHRDYELNNDINNNDDLEIHYDLINYVSDWCGCQTEQQCKELLQRINYEKSISSGEFIKSMLKINNIAEELKTCSELMGNVEFCSKLNEISSLTLKYIITNQSLYI